MYGNGGEGQARGQKKFIPPKLRDLGLEFLNLGLFVA